MRSMADHPDELRAWKRRVIAGKREHERNGTAPVGWSLLMPNRNCIVYDSQEEAERDWQRVGEKYAALAAGQIPMVGI